jgi:hypothetical protein
MSDTGGPGPRPTNSPDEIACSFCGKAKAEVGTLIAGQKAYICDECLGLCRDIMLEEVEGRRRSVEWAGWPLPLPPAPKRLRELHDLAFRLAKLCRAEPGIPKVIGDVAMSLALALEPPGGPRDP